MTNVLSYEVQGANGETIALSAYAGDVLLLVNVASQCGLTPQYAALEQLHRTYKDKGLRVLALPCNDFGAQEPGTIEEVQSFCSTTYGVTFEVLNKVHVLGEEALPLYAEALTAYEADPGDVQWNFEKFLIGRDGTIVERFRSKVTPDAPEFIAAVERALA